MFTKIDDHIKNHKKTNIIIAGISCSGKSTLAEQIRKHYSDKYQVSIVKQDDYFKDLKDIPYNHGGFLLDSINAFHTKEFKEDIKELFENSSVLMPEYDINSNKRTSKNKKVQLGRINIFEGLHTITLLNGMEDSIKIYIDETPSVCLARRQERDDREYGISAPIVADNWNRFIQPMCKTYIWPQEAFADYTLRGGVIREHK